MRQVNGLFRTTPRSLATSALLTLLFSATAAQATPLQVADDFSQLAETMQQDSKPLLLAFEAEHCNYCARLRAEHLQPMENNEGYKTKVMIRTLEHDGSHDVKGFNGETLSANDFSSKYKIRVTPTLLFLNAKGEEIAERILGYNSPEYYGYYLDKAIDTAAETMKAK